MNAEEADRLAKLEERVRELAEMKPKIDSLYPLQVRQSEILESSNAERERRTVADRKWRQRRALLAIIAISLQIVFELLRHWFN
jgi:hypothetical protein